VSTKEKDSRRVTAERNREAILDAAEELLRSGRGVNVSALASESGVSRVTVYSHFPETEEIVEAVVQRSVLRASAAIEGAEPDKGPADEALARVIATAWSEIGRDSAIAQGAATYLSAEAMHRAHAKARELVSRLLERGRSDGTFRTDLSSEWLLTCALSLIHAAHDAVRAGRVQSDRALDELTTTLGEIFAR
jgi:AcrR family transcriptional regulator